MPQHNQEKELAGFLARHVRLYDAEQDDYDRTPFAADVFSPGRSDFYNFHYYLTKVPPESITGLIRHYTKPGDILLDLFCGSGMTGVAVQMVNKGECGDQRFCILNDISPAACHIARSYTSPVSAKVLMEEYGKIAPLIDKHQQQLYSTDHFEPASGLYSMNSSVVLAALGESSSDTLFKDLPDQRIRLGKWQPATRAQVEDYYGYSLPNSDKGTPPDTWLRIPARLIYVVWSDVYKCEGFKTIEMATGKTNVKTGRPVTKKTRAVRGCGREIVARGTNDRQDDDGNNAFIRCPHCGERWMKGRVPRLRVEAVEERYEYPGIVSGRNGPTFKLMRASRSITRKQKSLITEISQKAIPFNFPVFRLDKSHPRYRRDSLAGKKIEEYSDFFTRRNLWALAALWDAVQTTDNEVQEALKFCFTSQIMRCSRLRRMKGDKPGEQLSGTLHIASETVETNVFTVFSRAVQDYCSSVGSASMADQAKPLVRLGSATDLSEIPDNSIDYVFTDPPFGSNIYYSGVTLMWEAWLGSFTNERLEAVMHREVDGGYKRIEHYANLMGVAFAEMFRVLKPGRFATIEFNNSDGAVFQVIRDGLQSAGFKIDNMLLFDKVARTFAQIRSTAGISEVVDKDVLFNVHKPSVLGSEASSDDLDLEHQVADAVRLYLQTLPERIKAEPGKYNDEHRTTATINSMLMNTLIPKGVGVEKLNLPFIERVCARYFRKVGTRWYLRGQAVGSNGGDTLVEEEITIRDEVTAIDWVRQKLHAQPMLIGELKPLWMRATGLLSGALSQSLNLDFLLEENFWRDPDTNRWREPTAEERERMNDDRSLRVLHDGERYLGGTLTRSTTDDERCKWIDVLFRACRDIEEKQAEALPALRGFDSEEAYRVITRLFQSVLKDHVKVDVFRRAEKQARAASTKISSRVELEKASAKAKEQDDKQTSLGLDL